ncbi:archaellin/type IV pilin N-terminal domain-containing protein [Halosolutus amylolyticus]|uniref:Flagellin n=1 Tax=Halosolutus amylolyticus TaxID=2932267 RepID=A0ABD5PQC8_9EURY|nr:archaellin/type IV pilin N-terminal domain-containing protein [Halosolutus amylolyticus]
MFEHIHSAEDRGQVGIGTLIVFIAMVLVAAIAAGVLINTAGSLQSQASDTGTETQQAVANQIEVVHAVAETQSDGDEAPGTSGTTNTTSYDTSEFDELQLVVKKSAGSEVIDMTSLTVQYTTESGSTTLAHDSVYVDDEVETEPHFTTTAATTDSDPNSLTDTSDRINLIIPLLDGDGQPADLNPGDSATVELIDQSGAKFSYGVTMPETTADGQTVVEV